MKRAGGKVGKGQTRVVTVSAPIGFIKYINMYSMNDFKGDNSRITVHLPVGLHDYYNCLGRGKRSPALVNMVENFVLNLEKYHIGKVFISTSALVRHSILHDMTRPIKERVLTRYIIERFFENMQYPKDKSRPTGDRICIGNICHPDGEWKKYYTTGEIKKLKIFKGIFKKVGKYYTERFVASNFMKFKKADQMGLLDNIRTNLDLKDIYNSIKYNEEI